MSVITLYINCAKHFITTIRLFLQLFAKHDRFPKPVMFDNYLQSQCILFMSSLSFSGTG